MATFADNKLCVGNCVIRNIWNEPAENWPDDARSISRRAKVGGRAKNNDHPKEDWQPIFEKPRDAHAG